MDRSHSSNKDTVMPGPDVTECATDRSLSSIAVTECATDPSPSSIAVTECATDRSPSSIAVTECATDRSPSSNAVTECATDRSQRSIAANECETDQSPQSSVITGYVSDQLINSSVVKECESYQSIGSNPLRACESDLSPVSNAVKGKFHGRFAEFLSESEFDSPQSSCSSVKPSEKIVPPDASFDHCSKNNHVLNSNGMKGQKNKRTLHFNLQNRTGNIPPECYSDVKRCCKKTSLYSSQGEGCKNISPPRASVAKGCENNQEPRSSTVSSKSAKHQSVTFAEEVKKIHRCELKKTLKVPAPKKKRKVTTLGKYLSAAYKTEAELFLSSELGDSSI